MEEKKESGVQWYTVLSAVIPTLVLMAGFVALVVDPVKNAMEVRTTYLVNQLERYSDVVSKVGQDFNDRMDEMHERLRQDERRSSENYSNAKEQLGRLTAQNEVLLRRVEMLERQLQNPTGE